jgi:acetyl/propionyl-CoA carboxylase alpha subunit
MPGMIVSFNKKVGDSVTQGETVVVLEAMKMENAGRQPKIPRRQIQQGLVEANEERWSMKIHEYQAKELFSAKQKPIRLPLLLKSASHNLAKKI